MKVNHIGENSSEEQHRGVLTPGNFCSPWHHAALVSRVVVGTRTRRAGQLTRVTNYLPESLTAQGITGLTLFSSQSPPEHQAQMHCPCKRCTWTWNVSPITWILSSRGFPDFIIWQLGRSFTLDCIWFAVLQGAIGSQGKKKGERGVVLRSYIRQRLISRTGAWPGFGTCFSS